MSFQEQKVMRYKLSPHVTLGNLKGSLIGLKANAITKIDGDGIIEFMEEISEYLIRDQGVSIKELEENFKVDGGQLVNVFDFLVSNRMCVRSDFDFSLTAFLAHERAGGQVSVKDILSRIQRDVVEVITRDNNPIAKAIIDNLLELGFNVYPQGELKVKPSIRIAAGTSHLDPILDEVNDTALKDEIPWLCIVPYDGQASWVGPFFIPFKSACLYCYNLRRSANFSDAVLRSELMEIQPLYTAKQPVYNLPINLVQTGIASNLITEWITLREYGPSTVPGGFTTINLDNKGISFSSHRVLRVPRCPKCSPAADTGFPQVWFHGEDGNLT